MSALGQKQTLQRLRAVSALPSKADKKYRASASCEQRREVHPQSEGISGRFAVADFQDQPDRRDRETSTANSEHATAY